MRFYISFILCCCSLLLSACNSNQEINVNNNKKEEHNLPNLTQSIVIQPLNKTRDCLLDFKVDNSANISDYKIYWDGSCIKGHAYGLGRAYIYKNDKLIFESIKEYSANNDVVTYFIKDNINKSYVLSYIDRTFDVKIMHGLFVDKSKKFLAVSNNIERTRPTSIHKDNDLSYLRKSRNKVLRYRDIRCKITKDDTILDLQNDIGFYNDICTMKRYELMTIVYKLSKF